MWYNVTVHIFGMGITDFIIGATLMNAMPHIIAGTRELRMSGGFGFGNTRNILWGLANIAVSLGLFIYTYGFSEILEHKMYLGALVVVGVMFATGRLQHRFYQKKA